MSIPAEDDAKRDLALRGLPLAVYHHCLTVLHPSEPRELPQLSVARLLRVSDRQLRRALNRLVARGYLGRSSAPARIGAPRRYTLVYSRPASGAVDSVHHPENPAA